MRTSWPIICASEAPEAKIRARAGTSPTFREGLVIAERYAGRGTSDQRSGPLADERIEPCFLGDGGRIAVPRQDAEVARQREEPVLDRREDRGERTAPQVRPPDRAPEQRVAGEEHRPVAFHTETDAPRRVPWRRDHLERRAAAPHALAVRQETRHLSRRLDLEPEERGLPIERFVERDVAFVEKERRAGDAREERRDTDVVQVRVRVEEADGLQPVRGESRQDAVRLVARVDDERLLRLQVGDDRAVALERSDRERVDELETHVRDSKRRDDRR